MNKELINEFESLLRSTGRDGIENLISFIRKSDFYEAPASTRFHSCHKGGLLEHTMNVYKCLNEKLNSATWGETLKSLSPSTIIIAPLLHDICKTYFYKQEFRNKKVYSETGKKSDPAGRFDWQVVEGYTIEDQFPYGHGEKSVMMIEQFIKLEPVERYMIRWHMGFTEAKENWNALGSAIKKYPAILALHEADLEATYLLEKEE